MNLKQEKGVHLQPKELLVLFSNKMLRFDIYFELAGQHPFY